MIFHTALQGIHRNYQIATCCPRKEKGRKPAVEKSFSFNKLFPSSAQITFQSLFLMYKEALVPLPLGPNWEYSLYKFCIDIWYSELNPVVLGNVD